MVPSRLRKAVKYSVLQLGWWNAGEILEFVRRRIEALRSAGPSGWISLCGVALLFYAYANLFTLGKRYSLASGVEYWLFRPTDNAPAVVLVLAGWLFYRRVYRLRALQKTTVSLGILVPVVLGAIGIQAWAFYTRADDLEVPSLILALCGLVLAGWGKAGVRALLLPLLFLLFAIPIPAPLLLAIVFKLQIWTAEFSGWLLYILGLPALVSGDQILRATQTFQVIEGCSGIRSMITLSMLTFLMIDLFGRRGWHAVILLLTVAPVAFVLNGFRVLTIILNPHSEIVAIHNLQGIAILLAGVMALYGVDTLLDWGVRRLKISSADWSPKGPSPSRPFSRSLSLGVLLGLAFPLSAMAWLAPRWEDPAEAPYLLHQIFSEELSTRSFERLEIEYSFRGSTRFRQTLDRTYDFDDVPVRIFVASADLGQRGGSHRSPITGLPGSGWRVLESSEGVGSDGYPFEERLVVKGKDRVLLRHWVFWDRGLLEESWRSLLALDRSFLRRPSTPLIIRLEVPVPERGDAGLNAARSSLDAVQVELKPALRRMTPTTSSD